MSKTMEFINQNFWFVFELFHIEIVPIKKGMKISDVSFIGAERILPGREYACWLDMTYTVGGKTITTTRTGKYRTYSTERKGKLNTSRK